MDLDWPLGLALVLAALAAALTGVGLLVLLTSRSGNRAAPVFQDSRSGTVFLFDGETLVDASPKGRALLSAALARGSSWQRLMTFIGPRFPGLEQQLAALPKSGRLVIESTATPGLGPVTLLAEWRGGLSRLSLIDVEGDGAQALSDPLTRRATEEELAMLRGTVSQAPLPIWLENGAKEVVWSNMAYLHLVTQRLGPEQELTWPLPRLMAVDGVGQQRLRLVSEGEAARWFDAVAKPAGDGVMVFALPSDALVQAEASLREFTQTLTKTFAHLPIGLAIFDRQRQLALFNPALHDLTGLPPDFLIARPTLFDFLDRLRDRQMIPEPKDYPSWRRRIADIEKAASTGAYEETWSLSGGQTYRVLGRPHPDGAMALLFEDISTEISRTRRYRADLELGQSVIDAMDEAVAVFSSAGLLVLSNAAYAGLWGHDPAEWVGADAGVSALAAHWRSLTAPSPLWAEVEEFAVGLGSRSAWGGEARLNDGRLIVCRFVPLSGGATMMAFRTPPAEDGTRAAFTSARSQLSA